MLSTGACNVCRVHGLVLSSVQSVQPLAEDGVLCLLIRDPELHEIKNLHAY